MRTRRLFKRGVPSLVAGLLVVGTVAAAPAASRGGGYSPTFEEVGCSAVQFAGRIPADTNGITCGLLTVKQNRAERMSGDNEVVLPVAIVRAERTKARPDPVVLLNGGPGGGALEYFIPVDATSGEPAFSEVVVQLLADRDVILMDQRGAGQATPSTKCPAMLGTLYGIFGAADDPIAEKAALHDSIVECADMLRVAGVDLDQYDTPTLARDLRDLRTALGIRKWNVYGHSYGGQLGLELLRQEPKPLRAVVLDSPVRPDVDAYSLAHWANVTERGFTAIAAAYGIDDLEARLAALIAKFNNAPYAAVDPYTSAQLLLTGEDVVHVLHSGMYLPDLIPALDLFLMNLEAYDTAGQFDLGAAMGFPEGMVPTVFDLYFLFFYPLYADAADGMMNAIMCADQARIAERMDLADLLAAEPVFGGKRADFPEFPQICDRISVDPVPWRTYRTSATKVPTLVRAGWLDVAVDPADSKRLSRKLGRWSQYLEFPLAGHNVQQYGECAADTLVQFVTHPKRVVGATCTTE